MATHPTPALVGTIGTAVQGASGASITTLAYGTGESRTAGNLLVCFCGVDGTATLPTTPAGWSVARQVAGASCSATIFWSVATGGDAAPTIAGITSGVIAAQLAEFSGVDVSAVDASGTATGTASPVTATNGNADPFIGCLILMASADFRSVARSTNDTWTSNHVTTVTQAGSNNGTSSVDHYSFGYGLTNSNTGADTAILTASVTTSITGIAVADAVFSQGQVGVASESFSGAITAAITRTITAGASFAGAYNAFTSRALAAASTSLTGAYNASTARAMSAVASFVGSYNASTARIAAGTASFAGSLAAVPSGPSGNPSLTATFTSRDANWTGP